MTRQKIVEYGDPVLRKIASRVLKFDKSLRKLVEDMFETMYASEGIGLAAPQINVSKRVIVLDVDYPTTRYDKETDKETNNYNPIVLINPIIIDKEGEMVSKEGCLSFPNVFIDVIRHKKITVKYHDLLGKDRRIIADGDLFCRCIQHEIEHLDGKLFIDKSADQDQTKKSLDESGFGNTDSPPSSVLTS